MDTVKSARRGTWMVAAAAILMGLVVTLPVFPQIALAHHKEGHTANCASFPESEFCQGVEVPPVEDTDTDDDGISDDTDLCATEPETVNGFEDLDGCPDEVPPVEAADSDDDGIADESDLCPTEAETVNGFQDDDGCPDEVPPTEGDDDGIADELDNCPTVSNADQTDSDGDGIGDLCDSTPTGDRDSDGIDNAVDNCPDDFNPDQANRGDDNRGNACDHHTHRHRHAMHNYTILAQNIAEIEALTQNYTVPIPDEYLGGQCIDAGCTATYPEYYSQNNISRGWEVYYAIQLSDLVWYELSDGQKAFLLLYLTETGDKPTEAS